jgi:hypothetical protein
MNIGRAPVMRYRYCSVRHTGTAAGAGNRHRTRRAPARREATRKGDRFAARKQIYRPDNFVGSERGSVEVRQNPIRVLKAQRERADNKAPWFDAIFFRNFD